MGRNTHVEQPEVVVEPASPAFEALQMQTHVHVNSAGCSRKPIATSAPNTNQQTSVVSRRTSMEVPAEVARLRGVIERQQKEVDDLRNLYGRLDTKVSQLSTTASTTTTRPHPTLNDGELAGPSRTSPGPINAITDDMSCKDINKTWKHVLEFAAQNPITEDQLAGLEELLQTEQETSFIRGALQKLFKEAELRTMTLTNDHSKGYVAMTNKGRRTIQRLVAQHYLKWKKEDERARTADLMRVVATVLSDMKRKGKLRARPNRQKKMVVMVMMDRCADRHLVDRID